MNLSDNDQISQPYKTKTSRDGNLNPNWELVEESVKITWQKGLRLERSKPTIWCREQKQNQLYFGWDKKVHMHNEAYKIYWKFS